MPPNRSVVNIKQECVYVCTAVAGLYISFKAVLYV